MKKPIMAILYDFDKTLSTEDMQNYSFIPSLGMTPDEFWGYTAEFSKNTGCEKILAYMYCMIKLANEKGIKITKEFLNSCGRNIKFFPGVKEYFQRINAYGESLGIQIEHYIVSSGTKEIIEGSPISQFFKGVYGCEFVFDENGNAVWPKFAVNYTQKTQYFFRISKGILDLQDDKSLNSRTQKRRVQYSNILYIGDGLTDVPMMTIAKQNNGHAIGLYQKNSKGIDPTLLKEGRVDFLCEADYRSGSVLDATIKDIIQSVSINSRIAERSKKLNKKF